jgi:hypothetical protein
MPKSDEIPPEKSGEFEQHFRWLKELHKHSKAKLKTKRWDLASRLKIWRMVHTESGELARSPLLIAIAKEFQQTLVAGNGDFFRAVAEASDALEQDDFFGKLNVETQAFTIYEELWRETGKQPSSNQVLKQLEEVLKVPLDKRQQNRARKALAPVYRRK